MFRSSGILFCVLFISLHICGQTIDPNYVPTMKNAPSTSMPRTDPAEDFLVLDVRGTIKATARFLPKPIYPEGARNAGVEGLVRVKITSDEQGNITEATALSGDALLSEVSVNAARQSKFRVVNPVSKIEGILTYSFEIRKAGWSRIASDLERLLLTGNSSLSIPVILKSFDPEWTSERSMLEELGEVASMNSRRPMITSSAMPNNLKLPKGTKGTSQTMIVVLPVPSVKGEAISRDLIASIKARLTNNAIAAWQFEVGLNLVTAFYMSKTIHSPRNPNAPQRGDAVRLISNSLENRPDGISDDVVWALKSLETNLRLEKPNKETDDEISKAIITILSIR